MTDDRNDAYLWDGSREPDPDVVRLERLLGTLRHAGTAPRWPDREPRYRRSGLRTFVLGAFAAAAVVLMCAGIWIAWLAAHRGWDVERIAGTPVVDGAAVSGTGQLHVGDWLVTDSTSRARMEVEEIGEVEVDPDTRLQLVRAGGQEHRLSLARGTIHARIWASPGLFYVNTPSAVTIDLGCAYTLHVDDTGAGLVRVTVGWVGFEFKGREAFIPQGAVCATRPDVGPGTPRYEDTPEGFGDALAILDFAPASDPRRGPALNLVLARARQRDAFTLWHLLTRGAPEERARVYDRMAQLAPPPEGVTRTAVLAGDRRATDKWWDSLGLEDTSWWRLLKRRW